MDYAYEVEIQFKAPLGALERFTFSQRPRITNIGTFLSLKDQVNDSEIMFHKDEISRVTVTRIEAGNKLERLLQEVVKTARETEPTPGKKSFARVPAGDFPDLVDEES